METIILRVDPREPDRKKIEKAAKAIAEGKLIAFPTETVYGLGADAFNPDAVRKIFIAKGRPADNPLIVHIGSISDLHKVAREIPEIASKIASKMWPGPLTMIFPRKESIPDVVTAGLDTVAVRYPAHPVALELIRLSGTLIAAPSANLSGRPSPTSAEHVIRDLMGRVDMIIDAGETIFGVESTIINVVKKPPILLRPGPLEVEKIREVIGMEIIIPPFARGLGEAKRAVAPGTKYRHYAPSTPLILVEMRDYSDLTPMVERILQLTKGNSKAVILASEETAGRYKHRDVKVMGSRKNLYTVAHNLFATLRELDEQGYKLAVVEGFPEKGLGLAIMNRLRKASSKVIVL